MSQQTILILGAGPGGLQCALSLTKRWTFKQNIKVILIDKQLFHVPRSSLYDVVTGKFNKKDGRIITDLIRNKAIQFIQDFVCHIDPIKQKVSLASTGDITYNYLVIGLGNISTNHRIKGVSDFARSLYCLEDGYRLNNEIRHLLRQSEGRIVIGGGGFSGTELAIYLAGFFRKQKISGVKFEIVVIESNSHILSGLPRQLVSKIEKILNESNIKVYGGRKIEKVDEGKIIFRDKYVLPYDLLIWTGGTVLNPVIDSSYFPLIDNHYIKTRKTLQVAGYSRVYAIGDIAGVRIADSLLPDLATYATQEGKHVARNIRRQINSRSLLSFRPATVPILISLGHRGYLMSKSIFIPIIGVQAWRKLLTYFYYLGLRSPL